MENEWFDALTQQFARIGSRRKVLRTLAGGALAVVLARTGMTEAAAQDAAAAPCLREGKACQRANQCCSGVCRRGKCRTAPGQGTCTIRRDTCRLTGGIGLGPTCNGVQGCECIRTKTGAALCREKLIGCFSCFDDQDCVTKVGPGAKCIAAGPCGDPCGIGDFCAAPCGFDIERLRQGGSPVGPTPAVS